MGSIRVKAGVASVYTALAIVHTYPLVLNLGSHLPGLGLGDNVSFVWNLWWMREALASPELDYFYCPLLLVPSGASLVLHTHTALAAFVGATLLTSLSVVQAQNLILIASLALNGFATYVLAIQVCRSRSAAIAAGALFVVAPAVTLRLMGHYNLVLAWPLIFACAACVAWVRRGSWWTSIVVGVAGGLIPYADYYYAVFFLAFVVVYLATELWAVQMRVSPRVNRTLSRILFALALAVLAAAITIWALGPSVLMLGPLRVSLRSTTNALTAAWMLAAAGVVAAWKFAFTWTRRQPDAVPSVRRLVVPLVVFLLLTSPLVVRVWQLWRSGDYVTQSSSLKSSPRGVDLATLVMGPPFHGLAGPSVRDVYAWNGIDAMESSAWMGTAVLVLVIVAISRMKQAREMRRWATIGVVFALWALGPYLQVLGANAGLLLPQAAVRLIPVLNNARIPGRAMVMVTLAGVMLIALLMASTARRRLAVSALVAVGVVESLAAPLPLSLLPDVGVYGMLGSDPHRTAAVLPVPFGIRDGFGEQGSFQHEALYAQTIHRHALAGGFLARVSPKVWTWHETSEPYKSLLRLSTGVEHVPLPSCEDAVSGLRAGGVSYVSVDRHTTPPALLAFVEQEMPVRRVTGDARHTLYKVAPERCLQTHN